MSDFEELDFLFYVDPLWDPNGIHRSAILKIIQNHNLNVHENTERNVLHIYDLPTLQILKGLAGPANGGKIPRAGRR